MAPAAFWVGLNLISTVALARWSRFAEMIPEPFLTVYLIHRQQTVQNGFLSH